MAAQFINFVFDKMACESMQRIEADRLSELKAAKICFFDSISLLILIKFNLNELLLLYFIFAFFLMREKPQNRRKRKKEFKCASGNYHDFCSILLGEV